MARNYNDVLDDELDAESASSEQIDIQHYLRILRKNKWPITFFTALVTTLAAYYAYTATPIYSSTSTLLIESQKANILSIEELYGVEQENGDYYQTQFEILKSRALARRVVKRLGLNGQVSAANVASGVESAESAGGMSVDGEAVADSATAKISSFITGLKEKFSDVTGVPVGTETPVTEETSIELVNGTSSETSGGQMNDNTESNPNSFDSTDKEDRELSLAVNRFMAGLTISPVRKTKLVKIGYESADPYLAATVANTVAEEYILSVLDARMEMKSKASQWLNDRLAVLKDKVDESETRLIRFKQDNGLVDVNGSVGRLNEQELLLATTELAQARSELSDANDLYREVKQLRNSAPELLESLPAIQDDALVRSVKIEFGQRQRELDELANRYGARHPKIVDAQSRIESLRTTLDGHIRRVVSSIEKDYKLRRQRVASIQGTLSAGKEKIQLIGEKKFKLDALEREVGTNRDLYNQFFSRITETNSSDGLDAANARVSDYAIPAAQPVKPKKQLIIALAALASLVLSMLMALLYEQLDETIKSSHDVEDKLGVKLLGILPLINKGVLGGRRQLPLNPLEIDDKKGTFTESVNTVRTALAIEDAGSKPLKVILVTSSVPGEGKSTTALNLAFSFSQIEKVLLIDCDMRRPSLAKALGQAKGINGLSSLITGTASARECIRRNAIGSMDVLPSGPIPGQPLELLSSSRFAKILEQLQKHYDKIIIDSAPTQAVSDSLVLSKLVDSVVYVVKSHETSYNLVKRGLARLTQIDAPIAGVLITQVDIEKITSYGGDYYYQGYYDYYGYNDKNEKGGDKSDSKIRLTPQELRTMKNDTDDVELNIDDFGHSDYQAAYSDVGNGHDSEFDLTTQMPAPTLPNDRTKTGRVRRSTARFSDDLDLV